MLGWLNGFPPRMTKKRVLIAVGGFIPKGRIKNAGFKAKTGAHRKVKIDVGLFDGNFCVRGI